MRFVTLGCLLVLVTLPAGANECPTGKPTRVTRVLPPVLGPGPLWVAAESFPIKWKGPAAPVQLVWVLDASARGQVMVTGKHRESGATLRFTNFGDTLGERQLRYRIDPIGYKPSVAKPDDFQKHNFDRSYGWFSQPGCYEITTRVGREQVQIFLEVVAAPGS
jgi:hypothetical protein